MTSLLAIRRSLHVPAIATALLAGAVAASAEPKIGAPAPDFATVDSNGKTQKLSDYRGKTVVLANECRYAHGAVQ